MALVICRVFFTLRMRRRMSSMFAMDQSFVRRPRPLATSLPLVLRYEPLLGLP